MLNSVRVRLTLWYAGVLALVLVLFAVSTYKLVALQVEAGMDTALLETARAFSEAFIHEYHEHRDQGVMVSTKDDAIVQSIRQFHFHDRMMIVFNDSGQLVAFSDPPFHSVVTAQVAFPQDAPVISPSFLESIRFGERAFGTFATVGGEYHRVCGIHTEIEGTTYVLAVAQPMREQEVMLRQIRNLFGLGWSVALGVALWGGFLLARKSLAPVVAMSETAAQISVANLHERLPVKNEKDELGQLAQTFNRLLNRLNQSFEQQRRFMADASHELRTPVAIIRGEASVALSQAERPAAELRESLGVVHTESLRMSRIIEDLFLLARADAGQQPLVMTDFYLDELLEDCLRSVRTLALQAGQTLAYDHPEEVFFHGDEGLIRLLVLNLLTNAIRYSGPQRRICMALAVHPETLVISVEDNGSGIPAAAQPHIFERFFRADKAWSRTNPEGGTGLGLPIARWIAEAHGGHLDLVKSDTSGTVFAVTLPFNP
ncbi:MAG: HAMP domain-containing histidine kinase [Blastocatellia bacterium]|nr:HAMP domain-containing histidine kinase [Blastocatellia bacterium]